jgi:hypothetical protein
MKQVIHPRNEVDVQAPKELLRFAILMLMLRGRKIAEAKQLRLAGIE